MSRKSKITYSCSHTKQLEEKYKDDPKYFVNGEFQANLLSETEKAQIRDLTSGISAVIGGAAGDSTYNAQLAGVIGQNAVENNVLSPEEYKRKVELINKAQGGTNGLNFKALAILNNGSLNEKEAREFLALVALDKYSDQLLKQYVKNPKSLSNEQLYDLTYLLNQASNGDPKKAQQIYSDAKFNIGTADPYTGEQLNQAIIKAKQSLSYANSTDKQLAEAAEPALFGLTGKLGTIIRYVGGLAGSYNVGQGSAKIADGKYNEGAVQVVNGALMIAPGSVINGAKVYDKAKVLDARYRQEQMLNDNIAFNISPTSWDSYPSIGRSGTFVTDGKAISTLLGNIRGKTEITITKAQAAKIEKEMGLNPGSLQGEFKIRQVSDIKNKMPNSPMEGNDYFRGAGNHLPGGHPEMVIKSISTKDNNTVKTILKVKVK